MARLNAMPTIKPITIDNFLGIDESVGETQVKLGSMVDGWNFKVSKNNKLVKREGAKTLVDGFWFNPDSCNGMWSGYIGGKNVLIFVLGQRVYEYDLDISTEETDIEQLITDGVVVFLGSVGSHNGDNCSIFWMNNLLYFFKDNTAFTSEYAVLQTYDGTTLQYAEPYIATIAINSPPSGGGTLFEETNLLSNFDYQTFVADGTSTSYKFARPYWTVYYHTTVWVNDTLQVLGTDYAENTTVSGITFTTAPASLASVKVQIPKRFSVGVENTLETIAEYKYTKLFGVGSSANLFIYGSEEEKNVYRFSALNDPTYFAANSYVSVQSDDSSITGLQPQYSDMLVIKKDFAGLITPSVNPNYEDNTGLNPYNFGYQPLNDSIGHDASNMVQLIGANPITLSKHAMQVWSSQTGVYGEITPDTVSDNLKLSLRDLDLSTAVTFNFESEQEFWINVEDKVYVWNYGDNTFYKHSDIEGNCFIEVNGEVYYGNDSEIRHMSSSYKGDGVDCEDIISCIAYGGFYDCGTLMYRKSMYEEWLSLKPGLKSSAEIGFATDRDNEADIEFRSAEYRTFDWDDIDFDDISFYTYLSAQSKRIRLKVKDFYTLQWIIKNETNDESCTVNEIVLLPEVLEY